MLTSKNPKAKACAVCERVFVPDRMGQVACRPACAMKKARTDRTAIEKAERESVKRRKEAVKRMPDLIAEAQTAFNAYIRARDASQPCICCGKPFEPMKPGGSVDAGHFRSRGAAGHLRFNEDNCFSQRKNCNRPGGTTYAAFRAGVVARIGEARVLALEADNAVHKWTHDELRAIRDTYKQKLKDMQA